MCNENNDTGGSCEHAGQYTEEKKVRNHDNMAHGRQIRRGSHGLAHSIAHKKEIFGLAPRFMGT